VIKLFISLNMSTRVRVGGTGLPTVAIHERVEGGAIMR